MVLPKHLQIAVDNFNANIHADGTPLTNAERLRRAKIIGAGFYRSIEGKIKVVK